MQYIYVPCYRIVPFSTEEYDKIMSDRWEQSLEAVQRWEDRISTIAYINSKPDELSNPECPNIAALWDEYDDGSGTWSAPSEENYRKRGKAEIDGKEYYVAFSTISENPEYPQANYALMLIDAKTEICFDSLNVLADLYSFGKELFIMKKASRQSRRKA